MTEPKDPPDASRPPLKHCLKAMTACFREQMVHDLTRLVEVLGRGEALSEPFEDFAARAERAANQFSMAHQIHRQLCHLVKHTDGEP